MLLLAREHFSLHFRHNILVLIHLKFFYVCTLIRSQQKASFMQNMNNAL